MVCRTHQKGIRSNTYDIIPREEWEVLEGCHEAIVSPEDWEKVQELIDRRPPIKGTPAPSTTCSTALSTAPPVGSPCRYAMRR